VRSSKISGEPSRRGDACGSTLARCNPYIGKPRRPKKWRLQLFRRKKSIILPYGGQVLDMCGLIPGETIPSSRSGSRNDRLTKCSPVRMFIPCRAGTGTYFRVELENVSSRAGVDCLLVRRKRNATNLFSLGTERMQRCSWVTTSPTSFCTCKPWFEVVLGRAAEGTFLKNVTEVKKRH